MTRPTLITITSLLVLAGPSPALGQVKFSGQVDLIATARRDSLGLNTNFRKDSPYSPVRLRLFASSWVTERIGIFGELLYDVDADVRINGAYVVVNELGGKSWLNSRLGLAPSLVGSFGLRSTYFNSNPLVGVPLLWHYRTNLDAGGGSDAAAIVAGRGTPGGGAPFMYDSCWNIQWELMGEAGRFEYSVGMTPGSLSNPRYARSVNGSQLLGRIGFVPLQGLRLGLSGAHGPYLAPPRPNQAGELPYAGDTKDFDQTVAGVDLEYARGRWVFHSEIFKGRWEAPLIPDDVDSTAGYVEGRFDVATGWYLAGRFDWMDFGTIALDGLQTAWDDGVRRTELALGYRLSREVLIKADWQRTTFDGTALSAQNLLALQLSSVF